MKRSKILLALFRFPYPAVDGTRYKILHDVIEGLSKEYDLDFLIATTETYSPDQIQYLSRWGKVHVFRKTKLSFLFAAVLGFFSKKPLQVSGFFDWRAAKWVRQNSNHYQGIYIHEIRMTEYFARLPEEIRRKCVLDFNDALSYNYQLSAIVRKFPYRQVYKLEAARVRQYESKMLRTFHCFNVVSERDKAILLQNAGMSDRSIRFVSIPHGVKIPSQRALLAPSNQLLFLGQLDYAPNRDALGYFFQVIWEPLLEVVPQLELHIVGKGKHQREGQNIFYHGYVPDLYTIVQNTALLIAPIRIGAGSPSKIIDAMSYGLPVLTTPEGTAGIAGAADGKNIIICEVSDIAGWVAAVKNVITNEIYRKSIGHNARSFIEEQYALQHSQELLRELFRVI